MRILQLTNNYPTNNYPVSGIFVKEQIDSLNKIGLLNEVYLINGRENGKVEYLKQIFKLRKHLKHNSYEVIHCHHALSAITLFLTGYRKKNVIISFQNDPEHELGKLIFKWLYRRSAAQIFKNNNPFVDNKTGYYLPNGVNLNLFKPIDKNIACKKLGLNKEKIYILFVSSNFLRKQKRYDRFSNVINILREKYKLLYIEEIKISNKERYLIPYYINATDVHLLTSDFEGSPNSVKECMACNIPVVSTNVGNVKELLSGVNGCYVSNSFDENEIAGLVVKALEDVKSNGRDKIVAMNLDIDSVAKKLNEIYNSILDITQNC